MNDAQIRESFHRKKLSKHLANQGTLIVQELGLKHGKCRADIAIINSYLIGYEIKSDDDSLRRLSKQIQAYNDVFDRATVIVGAKHAKAVSLRVPEWWGIIVTHKESNGDILFETTRPSRPNKEIDLFSVAQLLWRNEVINLLLGMGIPRKSLRKRRDILYQDLIDRVTPTELRRRVRDCLKNRIDWRCPAQPSPDDGSCRPISK